MTFGSRLKHAWNAFRGIESEYQYHGPGYSYRPDRPRLTRGNDRSIVTAVYNRISMDVASVNVRHVRLDEDKRYLNEIKSGLNDCLSLSANIDQTGRAFLQDVVLSMFDEGAVAVVPVETNINPKTGSFDILSLRTGKVVEWYPEDIRVDVYNEKTGQREQIVLPKKVVAIVENPFYAIMNEPNSTGHRLAQKLATLDSIDTQISANKLDLIIQLPYIIKTDAKRKQAEQRRQDIENQLKGSQYGIAYADGTERITQLNRSVDNNLLSQVQYFTELFFSQLGITQAILDGTADEKTMLNYQNRVIAPILTAIVEAMRRTFLTKTARSQGQSIEFFSDPFKLVPVSQIAEIADKFTRNCIMTSNEIRQTIGIKPSDDPQADKLVNSNISQPAETQGPEGAGGAEEEEVVAGYTISEISNMSPEELRSLPEEEQEEIRAYFQNQA